MAASKIERTKRSDWNCVRGCTRTGKAQFIDERLTLPLRWRKPARIFVNSMFDLFQEDVPDEWIDRIFAVMALAPQHQFLVLTKRAERMRQYMESRSTPDSHGYPAEDIRIHITNAANAPAGKYCREIVWPLPNVLLSTMENNNEPRCSSCGAGVSGGVDAYKHFFNRGF
jgi:hypothetical protein